MRTIDADNLSSRKLPAVGYEHVSGWYGNGWNDAIDTIMEDEPSVPLPDFKEGYKQAIRDGKTNFSRPHGEWLEWDDERWGGVWYYCSNCHNDALYKRVDGIFKQILSDYCPNCGADMRKEVDDGSGRIQK